MGGLWKKWTKKFVTYLPWGSLKKWTKIFVTYPTDEMRSFTVTVRMLLFSPFSLNFYTHKLCSSRGSVSLKKNKKFVFTWSCHSYLRGPVVKKKSPYEERMEVFSKKENGQNLLKSQKFLYQKKWEEKQVWSPWLVQIVLLGSSIHHSWLLFHAKSL